MSSGDVNADYRVLSTLNADGSRRWLRPRPAVGVWLTRRRVVGYLLIALFLAIPHLRINAKPVILLNIIDREFTFFGVTLFPTDTLLLALLVLSIFVSVFFLTAMFGRVWCGWACPQTVYMELVYRPIERFFDGMPGRYRKKGEWRRPAKYVAFLLISVILAHTFLAFFVGTERLAVWVTRSPFEHPISFLVVFGTVAMMMLDFCFFREQICITMCPYGRFQSVMLDRDSLIVGYDRERGEPRRRHRRATPKTADVPLPVASTEAGDCVDCGMCVTTCPTGIDIRDGLQLECVSCAQCIDACDAVMEKIGRPKGLIRYASQRSLDEKQRRLVRPRVLIYPAILAILVSGMTVMLSTRAGAEISLLRGPGMPFTVLANGMVANTVDVKVRNRSEAGAAYSIVLAGIDAAVLTADENPMQVGAGEIRTQPITIVTPPGVFSSGHADIAVNITGPDEFEQRIEYRLVGPMNAKTTSGGTP